MTNNRRNKKKQNTTHMETHNTTNATMTKKTHGE